METKLTGTTSEQARQLYELLKQREMPVEALEHIVPLSSDFIKEFCSVIKEQIAAEAEGHKYALGIISQVMNKLASIIENKEITDEERKDILDCISQLGEQLRNIQNAKQNGDTIFKSVLAVCVTFLIGILLILIGRKSPMQTNN